MTEFIHSVSHALLDADGSCRDVNFVGAKEAGIANMVKLLERHFHSVEVTNQNGEDVRHATLQSRSEQVPGQRWQAVLRRGVSALSQAQFSIFWDDTRTPDVEFTFFPQNVEDVTAVLPFCHDLKDALEARRFWVRYEDAQWTPDTTDQNNCVIYDSAAAPTQSQYS